MRRNERLPAFLRLLASHLRPCGTLILSSTDWPDATDPHTLRVDKGLAGAAWPQRGYDIECNDWRCSLDPKHDYVPAHNSHSAFVYARWITERGVPAAALTVVRFAYRPTRP